MHNHVVTYAVISSASNPLPIPKPIHTQQKLTRNPINRRRNPLPIARLQTIHHPQHLRRIPARARRIAQYQTDGLFGIDDEDGADGEGDALLVDVGGVLVIEHVVQVGDFALLVPDDGEFEGRGGDFVDVFDLWRGKGGVLVSCA